MTGLRQRRRIAQADGLALLLLLAGLAIVAGCRQSPSPPSLVVLISIDTLRADRLPAYGYGEGETPHLDALAREALLFENAYSHCPLTLPAHASLFTGRLPADHGIRDNLGYRLAAAGPATLASVLKAASYRTGAAVSSYVLRRDTGLDAGFDFYDDAIAPQADRTLDSLERAGGETTARALAWLDQESTKPAFLFLHLFEPHHPYEPPEPFRSRLKDPYDGEIAQADAIVGRFLEALRQRKLYQDALIVLVSDHGEGLGEHGESQHGLLLYRPTLHVPLLVKLPGGRRAGERVAAPAQLADVMPTVLEALGLEAPPELAGKSLLALGQENRRIYSETYYGRLHFGWSELRSLVDERFHYIEGPEPELYDLAADPREERNVLEQERRIYFELRQELDRFPKELAEPAAADPEVAARLAALGYLTAPAAATAGPRPDPKKNLGVLEELQKALAEQQAGRLESAVERLQAMQRSHPEMSDTYLLLAPLLRRLGRLEEAVVVSLEGQRRLPTLAPLISLELARIYLAQGDPAAAQAAAQAGLSANPEQGHELAARAAWAQQDLPRAVQEAEAALAATEPPRASALYLRGQLHLAQNQPAPAAQRLAQAAEQVRKGESTPILGLYSDQGDALARLGRGAEAEEAFRQEIATFPGNLTAYSRYAFLLATQQRFDEIEPLLEEMAQRLPGPEALRHGEETLEKLGNEEAAARWRQRVGVSTRTR